LWRTDNEACGIGGGIEAIEGAEIRKLTATEDTHWWYRERRALLRRALERLAGSGVGPGRALDIGAAGGGNTRVLRDHGWRPVALEYSEDGAAVAHERGLAVIRADARYLPLGASTIDLVVAFDILEHIVEDHVAAEEMLRVLSPGGTALIVVPADMALWSDHDTAVGHVRRYDRESLVTVVEKAGFVVDEVNSWNVLLRPAIRLARKRAEGSSLDHVPRMLNVGLGAVIAMERYLPVKRLPGVSLFLRARRPQLGR
jgi:SAM-dependent methyltransferase